jgi:hypothetical protein
MRRVLDVSSKQEKTDLTKGAVMKPDEILARHICEEAGFVPDGTYGDDLKRHWQGFLPDASRVFEKFKAGGYAIVPIQPSDAMIEELARIGDGPAISGEECWGYMLAAAAAETVST